MTRSPEGKTDTGTAWQAQEWYPRRGHCHIDATRASASLLKSLYPELIY
jgi:hypothetical protein